MARYAGDTFTITCTVTDSTGVLTDASSVTVSITLPDGTSAGPFSMTRSSVGTYTYAYLSSQAGMHTAAFVASGALSPNGTVDFYAYPVTSAATGIVTLAEAKTELRIASTVTTYDNQLRAWLIASRNLFEQRIGPLVAQTFVDTFNGGKIAVTLTRPPVISITSAVEGTYTLQASEYALSASSGILTRMFGAFPYRWLDGRQNIVITYRAGQVGVWPENVRLANLELLRAWWAASQSMGRPQGLAGGLAGGSDDMSPQGIGYYLTPRVEKMIGTSDLPPGIA